MAVNTKKISLHFFAGIIAAVIIIARVYTSGI
jgi:hypothetical protein